MNQYEIAILFDPGLEVDLEKATNRVEQILKENKAKVEKVDNWGKRKLAYRIKKHDHAIYLFYSVEVPAENVQKIESTLNITEEVIRFLIVKPEFRKSLKLKPLKQSVKSVWAIKLRKITKNLIPKLKAKPV